MAKNKNNLFYLLTLCAFFIQKEHFHAVHIGIDTPQKSANFLLCASLKYNVNRHLYHKLFFLFLTEQILAL